MKDWVVNYTKGAEQNLADIYEYIAFELLSPENAAGQVQRIMKMVQSLSYQPMRYHRYPEEPWHSKGLRSAPINNYAVFYYPDEERQTVTVLRIMYQGRDIANQLEHMDE